MEKSRIETLLEALLNGETADIVPQSRNEAYLKAMLENGVGEGVKTVNGVPPDENGNVEVSGDGTTMDTTLSVSGAAADAKAVGDELTALSEEIAKLPTTGGVQSDWSVNDESDPAFVKNRTHWVDRPYEPIVVMPDMVGAEGVDTIDISAAYGYPAGTIILYKVSDHVWTAEELENSKVYVYEADAEYSGQVSFSEAIPGVAWTVTCSVYDGNTYHNDGIVMMCAVTAGDFSDTIGTVIPSTGVYTTGWDDRTVKYEVNADTYHTIDKRYLPDVGISKEYVDSAIEQAVEEAITGAIGGSY